MTDIKMWREVHEVEGWQHFDGNGHFAIYDASRCLSFTWDGKAEWIEVSYGGYGEPVEWIIPAFIFEGTPGECIDAFATYCFSLLPEWDERIWDDSDYRYSEIHPHCGVVEKHVPVPKGRSVHFYNRETKQMDKRPA
jgi:hypothetical protein